MALALFDLQRKVCSDAAGRRATTSASKTAHTWTEAVAFCYADVRLTVRAQKAQTAAALQVIRDGQTAYSPAAVQGEVFSYEQVRPGARPKWIASLGANIEPVPPTPQHEWQRDGFNLPVYETPGYRLSIQTNHISGPTLDIWNTKLFRLLCQKGIEHLNGKGTPQTHIGKFWYLLPPEDLNEIAFRYDSLMVPGTEAPTIEVLSNVLMTLDLLFESQGARPLTFSLLSDRDGHIGVGYMYFGRLPPLPSPGVDAAGLTLVSTADTGYQAIEAS